MALESAFELAQQIAPRLLPLLPYLIEGSKQLKEKILDQITPDAVKNALDIGEHIWNKLKPKIDEQEAMKKTVEAAAAQPADPKLAEELSRVIETLLQDEQLRQSVAEIVRAGANQHVEIASFIEVGELYSTVRSVEIEDIKDLQNATVTSNVKVQKAGKGSDIRGVSIGSGSSTKFLNPGGDKE